MRAFGCLLAWAAALLGAAAAAEDALPTALPSAEGDAAPAPRVLQRLPNGSLPRECLVDGVACFPKCCPLGQIFRNGSCEPEHVPFDPLIVFKNDTDLGKNLSDWAPNSYYLVMGNPCDSWFRENLSNIDVWSSGELVLYTENDSDIIPPSEFCLEYSEKDTEAIICHKPHVQIGVASWLYTSGMLVSVSGLLLTLGVYLAVDALRDLHGKSLICHVGCLAVAYSLLAAVQLSGKTNFSPDVCRRMAFAIQFFLLSSFLWLHVMCLDAFWCVLEATNSSPVPYPRAKKWTYDNTKNRWVTGLNVDELDETKEEARRLRDKMVERYVFAGYSIYVWVLSLTPVLAVLIHNLSPTIPATYVDHNMKLHCELIDEKTEESLLYFYPFTAIFIIFNTIIFICILIKAVPFKWNASGPQRVPKQKARMCFLLFVLMSSNWIVDLISWSLGGTKVVWVMLHAFYILQGLITFLIFVLEDRVKDRIVHKLWPRIRRINKKYGCCHRKHTEEEATALRSVGSPDKCQPMGWVRNN